MSSGVAATSLSSFTARPYSLFSRLRVGCTPSASTKASQVGFSCVCIVGVGALAPLLPLVPLLEVITTLGEVLSSSSSLSILLLLYRALPAFLRVTGALPGVTSRFTSLRVVTCCSAWRCRWAATRSATRAGVSEGLSYCRSLKVRKHSRPSSEGGVRHFTFSSFVIVLFSSSSSFSAHSSANR